MKVRKKHTLWLLWVLVANCASTQVASKVRRQLWSPVSESRSLEETPLRNRRLEDVEKEFMNVDWDSVVTVLDTVDAIGQVVGKPRENDGDEDVAWPEISIVLPGGRELTCTLKKSALLHEELVAKVPLVKVAAGTCEDGSTIDLTSMVTANDSMSAVISSPDGEVFYVDSAFQSTSTYVVYSQAAARPSADSHQAFACGNDEHDERVLLAEATKAWEEELRHRTPRRDLQTDQTKGYIFRIAMTANKEYSAFHGNTIPSVLAAISKALSRVNGIFSREMGIYFQLFSDNDKTICLKDNSCTYDLPNTNNLLDANPGFLEYRQVSPDSYDIGHALSTGSGGVATYPSICNDFVKARGTTGMAAPNADRFYVDYLSHEIGHQLKGPHSFRDCGGNIMTVGANEPGSGTTIMSYAGLCGSANVQTFSDPYFNSLHLDQMRSHVDGAVARDSTCGQVVNTGKPRPKVESSVSTCVVPVGNFFQLGARNGNPSATRNMFFAFDRIDVGAADYGDRNVGRFRPWKPTRMPFRTFPNMYYLSHGLEDSQMDERLPTSDTEMKFRIIGRTLYDSTALLQAQTQVSIGDYDFKDITVRFQSSNGALRILDKEILKATPLRPYTTREFRWIVSDTNRLSSNVKFMIAINTMPKVSRFDNEQHLKALNWVEIATVPNTGVARLNIPQLVNNQQVTVNLMLRSATSDDCFFFDMVNGITLSATPSSPVQPPVPSPVTLPTNYPTSRPTDRPTARPTQFPTRYPTVRPTARPTNRPTSRPTEFPTRYPTAFPTVRPTSRPTEPTQRPTRSPTRPGETFAPTRTPTVIPTSSPTRLRTSSPTPIVADESATSSPTMEQIIQHGPEKVAPEGSVANQTGSLSAFQPGSDSFNLLMGGAGLMFLMVVVGTAARVRYGPAGTKRRRGGNDDLDDLEVGFAKDTTGNKPTRLSWRWFGGGGADQQPGYQDEDSFAAVSRTSRRKSLIKPTTSFDIEPEGDRGDAFHAQRSSRRSMGNRQTSFQQYEQDEDLDNDLGDEDLQEDSFNEYEEDGWDLPPPPPPPPSSRTQRFGSEDSQSSPSKTFVSAAASSLRNSFRRMMSPSQPPANPALTSYVASSPLGSASSAPSSQSNGKEPHWKRVMREREALEKQREEEEALRRQAKLEQIEASSPEPKRFSVLRAFTAPKTKGASALSKPTAASKPPSTQPPKQLRWNPTPSSFVPPSSQASSSSWVNKPAQPKEESSRVANMVKKLSSSSSSSTSSSSNVVWPPAGGSSAPRRPVNPPVVERYKSVIQKKKHPNSSSSKKNLSTTQTQEEVNWARYR